MELQTKIPFSKQSSNLINYESEILLLGSCFVANIGEILGYFKFQNTINPFGILFNTMAIETLISNAISNKKYTEEDLFQHNNLWHCFDAHSKLSNTSKDDVLQKLNTQIDLTKHQIQQSTHIIITLGTAWVYRHKETKSVVANCHKVPQKYFSKELLSVDEIYESLKNSVGLIRAINPNASIIFTVSPIRHLKDGFIENNQSKAHLIAGIHNYLSERGLLSDVETYFPSYEILMDELRDYRFYNEDMIHPNTAAINYIWEKFKSVWISDEAQDILNEVETIQKGLSHKPFNPESEAHQKFLQTLEAKIKALKSRFPHIVF
ncbi:MAG: GSCFA domain-containing protein [Jejuia sp.]